MRAALLCALLLGGGCGQDGTLITVTVVGRPAEVQRLQVSASLSGKVVQGEEVTSSLDLFGLLLPTGATGFFDVRLDGVGADGMIIARGCTNTMLTGRGAERIKAPMYSLSSSKDTCKTAAGGG